MENKSTLWIIILLFFSSQNNISGQTTIHKLPNGTVYRIIQADDSYTLDSAVYHIFIPESAEKIRGVFIHQHGCTMEGRGVSTAYDIQYQAFAKKWNLAIIGPDLYSASGNCHNWKNPESGSGDALLKTLKETGEISGHPELTNAPWLLWGHSGGGYWAQAMMRDYPERTIALFSYSPGLNPTWDYPKEALKIPVMIRHAGITGDACCWESALNTYNKLRKNGGYVSIAYTPYQNHNFSYVRYMAIPFFESVLTQRLSETNPDILHEMDPSKVWLGDTLRLNTYKASGYKGDKNSMSWLPDSTVAAKWKEYIITGTVIDRTPPPAPYDLNLSVKHNRAVELTWKADADIESGIKFFNIYKDSHLITRYPSSGDYQTFDTNGDDAFPVSTLPEMKLELTGIIVEGHKISISSVNHFMLESDRTDFSQ